MSLDETRKTFEKLAKSDPLWTVLTVPKSKRRQWDAQAFFETGEREVAGVMADLEKLGKGGRRGRAMDFGCAVGRLTQALASHYDEVVGVDISAPFVELARRYNRHGDRCSYRLNTTSDLNQFDDGQFDLIYSNITLQHSPPADAVNYIGEFVRLLAPGGVAVFQAPSGMKPFDWTLAWVLRRLRWLLVSPIKRRIAVMRGKPLVYFHTVPRQTVEDTIRKAGGRIIDVTSDGAAGRGWVSYRYVAEKAI